MIGTILGNRYELLEKIGEGGMAEVYKAKCALLNRYVAVKILKNQYSDNAEFVNKFKQEASAVASLSHSNIVGIYDIGSENNINYIVMEYIDGKTLKQIINEQKFLRYNDAIILALQIAKALECAHNNNIIHKDIKPHNILVTRDGIVKVTDFGIAKATTSVTITNSERVVGSAHYFSPEQAKGSVVDCKTDIYSLGIVLYEMVTGKLPFDGESPVSVALKHIQEEVIPPKELNHDIPENLNKLILKCIQKEPYKRYENAHVLIDDLQKIKQNQITSIEISKDESDFTRVMKPITFIDNEDDESDYEDMDELDNNKKWFNKRNKKYIVISLVVISIFLVGFVAAYVAINNGPNQDNILSKTGKAIVPEIIGLSKDEAERLVEEQGLKFVTTTESSNKPAGVVLNCYPYPGTEVDRSETDEVRAIVSSGPKVSAVPSLIEIEFEAAKEYLKTYNLELGKVTYEFSDTIDKGKVSGQSPEPESPLGSTNIVDLVVSKGPENKVTKVPNLINKNLDEAEQLLLDAKLKIGTLTKIRTDDESLDGIVSVQSIEAGKEVNENSVINISYYSFSDKGIVIVPNFVNRTVREAKNLAREYNLILEVEGRDDFIITSQDKLPGREVEEETVIKLRSEPNP